MSKLELWKPVKPYHLNQGFGSNPDYYAKFHDACGNPLKGHNGNDLMAVHGQPVYASVDGQAFFQKDAHGGEGIYIATNDAYDYVGGQCWFLVVYWHLIGDTDPKYPSPIPLDGSKVPVKIGDLIGYANNTGAPYESSGDHLHLGLIPVDGNKKLIAPCNGYSGNVDPAPYFVNFFAEDYTKVMAIYAKIIELLKGALGK